MAFDLKSAKPIATGGFDLKSARPVDSRKTDTPKKKKEEEGFFSSLGTAFQRGVPTIQEGLSTIIEDAPRILGDTLAAVSLGNVGAQLQFRGLGQAAAKSQPYKEIVKAPVESLRESAALERARLGPGTYGSFSEEKGLGRKLASLSETVAESALPVVAGLGVGALTRSPVAAGLVMGAGNVPMTYGGIRETQKAEGIDDVGRAIAGTAASSALDLLTGVGGKVLSGTAAIATREILEAGLKQAALRVAKSGVEESGTEVLQNVIEQVAGGADPTTKKAMLETLEAGLAGALGGTVFTGATEVVAAPFRPKAGAAAAADDAGAPPPPPPAAPPPANMGPLAEALGPVGGKITLQDAFGPQEYTFEGFDKKGKVVLTDADGVTLSEDPDWVQNAIKSGIVESEEGLGGMAFGMDIEEDVAAPPPPPPPPPPAAGIGSNKPKFTIETLEEEAAQEAAPAPILYHGGRSGLTLDDLQIVREPGATKQGRKGRVYGGFYATENESEAIVYANMAGEGNTVYEVQLRPDAVVENIEGDITRLSPQKIDEYRARGVDVVVGKDVRGRTEHVVINKDAVTGLVDTNAAPKPKLTIEMPPPSPRNTQGRSQVGIADWDLQNRSNRSETLFEGDVTTRQTRAQAVADYGNRAVHGLSKAGTATQAYNDVVNILENGINPERGGGALYTGPLDATTNSGAGVGTASGTAYFDGPFALVGRDGHVGQFTSADQIAGILVNDALADTNAVEDLRQRFPNLAVETYSNAGNLLAQTQAAPPPPPPPPPPAAPRAVGKAARVTIPVNRQKFDVQYELQDLDNIKFAEDELQNRDRSRPASDAFVTDTVNNFDPEGLGEDRYTDRGAPIINKDNTILSGNGRTQVLQEIYGFHPDKAEIYKESLREQGYDIEGIERPVLVRRLMSDADERKFVTASNESDIAALSPPEQAAQDASDILTPGVFAKFKGGDLGAAKNDAFVSAFLAEMSPQQRKNAMDDKGKISAQGLKRIENALLYKAYGGTGRASKIFISKAMERNDDDTKTLTNALVDVSKDWIQFQQAIEAGEVDKKYDITNKLMETIGTASDIKASGNSVGFELRSPDMVNPMDPFVREILLAFHNDDVSRILSKKAIADKLRAYAEVAANQQPEPDMFGMSETPSAREIWKRIDSGEGAPQSDLYASIAEPSTNLTDTPSSTDIMALADELPAAERVNVRASLNKILSRYEKNGTIDQLLGSLEQLYTAVNNRIKRNRAKKELDRVRGFERAMERSYRAEREGILTPESAKLLRWLLQKNPAIAEELALSFESGGENAPAGFYNTAERIAIIFYNNANEGTAVHEVLHHTERLMPEKIRDGIRAEWTKRIKNLTELAEKTGNTDAREVLGTIVRSYYGDSAARKELYESYTAGTIPYSMYHLSNPSEFWAVNATELVAKRAQQTGWVGGARKWLEGFIEKAKDFFGLNSNSAVIKGLDAVLKQESGRTRGEMIASGGRKLRRDANKKAQEEIEGNAQFKDITSIDAKRTEKKLSELESMLGDLDKAMKDEAFGIPQMQRRIVSALDNALNSLDDIADNAPAEFNDRIDDLEIKIADLKAVAGASLKTANENKPETEVQKAERELRMATQAFNNLFYSAEDERGFKDRRTKERKAYEKELDQLEAAKDEAFAKWDKLYREEKGMSVIEDDTQFRDIARPEEQTEEDFDTEAIAEPTPAKLSRVRQSVNRLRTSATWSNIASQFSGARAVDNWLARSYGLESLPETDSFYSNFETYLSKKNGKLQQLRRNYVDPIDDAVGDAIKNGVTMDDINDAIQARGAAERNAAIAEINEDMPDGGSGLTNAEADAKLRELQASGKMRYINRVVRLHDRLRDETQRIMVQDGLVSAETMAEWKRKYPNYTPYKGWAPTGDMAVDGQEDPHADYGSYDKGVPVYSRVAGLRAKPIKAAKGRSSQAANSLYNMIADAEMFLEMGQRNQIALQLDRTYQSDPDAFEGLLKIYDKQNPKIVNGKAVKITDERAFKNGIRGFKNGEPFIIDTAPNEEGQAVRRAFTNLDPSQLDKWLGGFYKVMGVMRGLHTRFNAAFWPREFLRSISDAVGNVYTEKGRKRSAAYGKSAAMKTWKYSWDPATQAGVFAHLINRDAGSGRIAHVKALTEEMIVNGGAAGQEFAERAERVAKRMEAELKRMTATGVKAGYFETKAGFAKLIKVVDGINDFVDIVPRVAAYRALTEAGLSPKDAAQIALRSTLDMSKRGRFGRLIDSVFWWTTPSITNLTKKVTGLDSSTYRKMVLAQLAVGFALGMLNVMNAPDSDDDGEDDYSQLPEWRKLAYLHVYYSPDEKPFTMPIGFLFLFERYVGGKMAEVLAGQISDGKAAVDIMTASQDVGAAFLASLSPVVRSTEARTLAPSSIAPIWDLNLNESFFKTPIYNEPFDDSEAQASRVKPTTPEVYKIIAKGLQEATRGYGRIPGDIDVSPDQIKYFVDQYAGGVGRLVSGAAEGDIEAVKKLNPFYFDPKLVEYSPMGSFYERDPEMKRAIAADKLADEGDSSERDFLENTNPVSVDSGVISAFKDAQKELKDLRKDANETDPKEYRAEQLRIMSEFNRAYNDAKKGNYSYTSSADEDEEDTFIPEEEEGDE